MAFDWPLPRRASRPDAAHEGQATSLPIERLLSMRAAPGNDQPHSRRALTRLPGTALTRLRGQGLEFDDLRPYAEGDDVRHIDWRVTARTGRTHTRLYREERERAVTVALDLRSSMFTGSLRLRAVAAGEIAARLLWGVAARRDRAGALLFDDAVVEATRPSARDRGVVEALGAMARMFEASREKAAAIPAAADRPLEDIVTWINRSRQSGAVVLVTGFDNGGPALPRELAEAGRRGRLSVLLVTDPIEMQGLAPGSFSWRGESGPRRIRLDARRSETLRGAIAEARRRRIGMIEAAGVPAIEIGSEAVPAGLVGLAEAAGMI